MDSAASDVVRIGGPAEIAGIVPYLVGFQPAESVVLICLDGPNRRRGVVARLDLPPPDEEAAAAELLGWHVARAGAQALVVAVYAEEPDTGGVLPRTGLVDAIKAASSAEVIEALLVRSGRWWSYECRDEACCPPGGTVIPACPEGAVGRVAAESAVDGRVVLADRAALAESIEPEPDATARQGEQARRAAQQRLDQAVERGGPAAARAETVRLLTDAAAHWTCGSRALDRTDAATIVIGLHDKVARDRALVLALDLDEAAYLALLVQLCRHAGDADAAPICTVLAWAAYLRGNGALANVGVERALRCDPDYLMAELVQRGLAAQIRPERVRELTSAVRRDLDGEPER